MARILCCWLPNWAIQRRRCSQPELSNQAIVIYASDGRRGERVVTCCGHAYRYGVRPQMPLAEAKALAGRRPLMLVPHAPVADRQALEELAARCEAFSPAVALEEGDAPESLLLDITGLEHLLGREEELAARLVEHLGSVPWGKQSSAEAKIREGGARPGEGGVRRGGFGGAPPNEAPSGHTSPLRQTLRNVRIAVAGTVGAAWAMAHYGHTLQPPPPSPVIVPPGEDHLLFALPVEALRLSGELVEVLTQLGIVSIEQVLELPRASLATRFGDELLRRVDQLTGCVPEVVVPYRPPPPFATQWLLEHPTTDRNTLHIIVEKLANELVGRLLTAGEGAVRLVLTLDCGREPLRLRIGLFRPSADARHLLELLEMQLENLQVPKPIDRVELAVPITARLAVRQHELFDDGRATQSRELALLIDRLSSRLGAEAVVRPQLGASALPERACRYVPLTEGKPRTRTGTVQAAPPRPLWLFAPRPIEVVSVAPDGPPQCVWLDQRRQNVTQSWGPERIETGWWRGPPVARDYYRIETDAGNRLWIFRRLADGQWFAQGEFG